MSEPSRVHSTAATATAIAIVLAGLALRLASITAGLPHRLTNDEPFVLGTALRMLQSGDFNPHFFDYGGFTIYLQLLVGIGTFMAGALSGEWTSVGQFWEGAMAGPARIVTALMGTATIAIVYAGAARISRPVALVAALTIAVHTAHVRDSHFALTDVPLTFLLALAWLLSIRAAEGGHTGRWAWAGIAVGLAAATKIVGIVGIVLPAAAALPLLDRRTPGRLVVIGGGAALGFLVASPYSLLALPEFLNNFAHLSDKYNQPIGFFEVASTYLKYLRTWFTWPGVLPTALGWLPLAAGGVGLGALIAGVRSRFDLAVRGSLMAFGLCYLAVLARQGGVIYGRYALPLLPVVAVGFGAGVMWLGARLGGARPKTRRRVTIALLLLLLPTLATSVAWVRQHAQVSTVDQAAAWITEHVAPAAGIATETTLYLPPTFRWQSVARISDRAPAAWRAEGTQYLVASSAVTEVEVATHRPIRRQIETQGRIVAIFGPSADHPGPTITVYRLDPASANRPYDEE